MVRFSAARIRVRMAARSDIDDAKKSHRPASHFDQDAMTHHHLKATPDNIHWGYWDASIAPVLKINSGDRVTIETLSGDVPHLPKTESEFVILPDHRAVIEAGRRGPGPHHLTGPIEIAGAEPGHVLEVRIVDIKLRQDWGWNIQLPCMGTLPEDFQEARLFHIALVAAANIGKLPW